ncbi:ComEC/Rec2 family competence protein [Microbacterium indicum]|uniref:ComEC/Rec2 family competence protein n=1 Tax=Microbacterium indicum TaxID=358100 RepID=UPI000429C8E6|nr:ComEC/Rec2 family competence protein [Microbacterium indicum]
MTSRDLRLLPVALAVWAAALAAVLLPHAAGGISAGLWAAAVSCLAAARRAPVAALVLVACAGAALVTGHVAILQPARDAAADELDGVAAGLVVDVTTKVEPGSGQLRFTGTAVATGATVTVLWPADGPVAGLDLGARVEVDGGARPTGPGDASVAIVFADDVRVRDPPPHVYGAASTLRRGFVGDVVRGLPAPGAGLLPGLSVGETSGVGLDLDAAMKASSLSHLTAVSGANCALVVGIAFGACAACGARRSVRLGVSLAALAGFVVLVTPEASVIRAGAMAAVAMLAVLLGRQGAGVAVLSLAVASLVVADPWLATDYGFLLSAAATGALLLLAQPLADGLGRWMPRAVALGIAVPLAAQVVCAPIIVLFAPQVALYGVVANMIAGPAAPAATVLGLVACLAQPFPPLALGAAALAWLPSAWVAQTAQVFAGLPAADLGWAGGALGFLALAALGVCAVALIVRVPPSSAGRAVRRASAAVLALVLGVAAGSVAVTSVAGPLTAPRDWSIALCDVGQGDAVLLRSAGATALVDTGPEPAALAACLDRLGVSHVDIAFVTHFDADHVGGAEALAGRVGTVIHGPADPDDDPEVLEGLGADRVVEGSAGMSGALGTAAWRLLWPRAGSRAFEPGNDTSLVLDVAGGGIPRTLLLGDLSEASQSFLEPELGGAYDVVKVSHHGSRDQLPRLYLEVAPEVALIGVGENDYGHPNPDTLAVLAQAGASVARSDEDGLVLISTSPDLTIWRER